MAKKPDTDADPAVDAKTGPNPKPCCGPSAVARGPSGAAEVPTSKTPPVDALGETVLIPGGAGLLGTADPKITLDGEGPLRTTKIKPFRIGVGAVSNAEFARFVAATGYQTEAERFDWSFVFWAQVPKELGKTQGLAEASWWRQVNGANWRAVNGPGSEGQAGMDHPVVHVSWNDARAYAAWAGGRLPTEAEWEHAARGGLGDVPYPWGQGDPDDTNHHPCNIWQGIFPQNNTGADGYVTTAPVRSFATNGYGLYNVVGNVWEWTQDSYRVKSLRKEVRARLAGMKGYRTTKGGSFLCHQSYCWRYRIAARTGNSPDSSTTHTGFRVVYPA